MQAFQMRDFIFVQSALYILQLYGFLTLLGCKASLVADCDGVAQSQGAWGLPATCRLFQMLLLLKGGGEECLYFN